MAAFVLGCSGDSGGTEGSTSTGEEATTVESTETGGPGSPVAFPSDTCEGAPTVGVGVWSGGFAAAGGEFGGACGLGGPDAFVRVEFTRRVDLRVDAVGEGYTPRFAILPDHCVSGGAGSEIACADGHPDGEEPEESTAIWVRDFPAGSAARVVVGADAGTLEEAQANGSTLSFDLHLELRPVLSAGEICMPEVLGRCVGGTVCQPESEEDGATWRCTPVAADVCADAEEIDLGAGAAVVSLTELPLQSDAHHHSCAGAGTVERVYRLRLPTQVEQGAELRATAPGAGVGLAVRAPGCEIGDERACAAPVEGGGAQVSVPGIEGFAAAGQQPYLFVEWSSEEPPEVPLTVDLEVGPAGG